MTEVDFIEEMRCLGEDFQAEEYTAELKRLAEEITNAEDALLETLSNEQKQLFMELDDAVWEYAQVMEKDAFYKGFRVAKATLINK